MLKRLSSRRPALPDLFFFLDDYVAKGALMALAASGVRIPEGVKVIVFANKGNGPVYVKDLMSIKNIGAALALSFAIAANAAEKHWLGTDTSNPTLASVAANWDPSGAPTADDDVVLDSESMNHDMTWDLDNGVKSWTQSDYTGTVTFKTGTSVTYSGNTYTCYGVKTLEFRSDLNSNVYRRWTREKRGPYDWERVRREVSEDLGRFAAIGMEPDFGAKLHDGLFQPTNRAAFAGLRGVIGHGNALLETLRWFRAEGMPTLKFLRVMRDEVHRMKPGNVVWTEPLLGGIAGSCDMSADWLYEYSEFLTLSSLRSMAVAPRIAEMPFMPTLTAYHYPAQHGELETAKYLADPSTPIATVAEVGVPSGDPLQAHLERA